MRAASWLKLYVKPVRRAMAIVALRPGRIPINSPAPVLMIKVIILSGCKTIEIASNTYCIIISPYGRTALKPYWNNTVIRPMVTTVIISACHHLTAPRYMRRTNINIPPVR